MAKILVADDNSNIQKMVGLALKDQGIDVVAVGNGEAAVRKISDLKPDLVLADVFMPVRNGYEVCKYVKEDSALAHIPVILLVGAFDPLDEQEAQRVGADGVLKKPFVPPDPLISMVKSALARAGVPLGNTPPAEKVPEPPKRNTADLLSPAASKLAALSAARLPDEEPEPMPEEFPTMPAQVKIAAGHEPVAFGSLLETPEAEDEAAFIPAIPPTELGSAPNWAAEEVEEDDVAEEETGNGWRPGGDLTAVEASESEIQSKVEDWREEAFHGSSPARANRSQRWEPAAVAEPEFAESSNSRAVAVTTLEPKPSDVPAFSGDAWAAAMAAGVEEKLAEKHEALTSPAEPEHLMEAVPEVESKEAATEEVHSQQAPPVVKTENNWYSVSASPWEMEAKKATLLASTWDSVAAEPPPAVSEPEPAEPVSAYAGETPAEIAEPVQEFVHGAQPEEAPAQLHEVTFDSANEPAVPSPYSAEPGVNDTQEIESYEPAAPKSLENTWGTAAPEVVNQFVETPAQEFVEAHTEPFLEQQPEVTATHEPVVAQEPVAEQEPVIDQEAPVTEEAASEPAPAAAQAPNMDDLVARVLSRMSPDVLHKVTQDILKPVIEALIQDELNSKKQ